VKEDPVYAILQVWDGTHAAKVELYVVYWFKPNMPWLTNCVYL